MREVIIAGISHAARGTMRAALPTLRGIDRVADSSKSVRGRGLAELAQFRAETREWLEGNCPRTMRMPASEAEAIGGGKKQIYRNTDAKLWLERMAGKGWTAPMWPTEYGGGGLDKEAFLILQDEMLRINARAPIGGMGFSMIGPTLLEYGTD